MRSEAIPAIGDDRVMFKGYKPEGVPCFVADIAHDHMGGVFAKRKVTLGLIKNENIRYISAVTKTAYCAEKHCFGQERVNMTNAQRYYFRWKFLRDNGIPTVTSMRIFGDESVIMGDMTADGSMFFGKEKGFDTYDEIMKGKKRELSYLELQFLSIPPEVIKQEVNRVQEKLFALGGRMPQDDRYDLIVHPDGSFEVLILDLTDMKKVKNQKKEFEELEKERKILHGHIDCLRKDLMEIALY